MSREKNTRIQNMNEFVNADKASVDFYSDKAAVTTQIYPDDDGLYSEEKPSRTEDPRTDEPDTMEFESTDASERTATAHKHTDKGNIAVRGKVVAGHRNAPRKTESPNKKYSDIVNERNAGRRKKRFAFGKFLIIYSIVLLVLVAAGSILFAVYLNNYENTRPDTFAAETAEKFSDDTVLAAFIKKNCEFTDVYDSADDIIESYVSYVNGAGFAYERANSFTDDAPVYYITANGTVVAEMTLTAADEDIFGLTEWDILELDILSYIPELRTITILAPAGSTVLVDGDEVTAEYITSSGVPDIIGEAAEYLEEIPEYDTYSLTTVKSDLTVTGLDENGESVSYSSSDTLFVAGGTASDEFILAISARTEVALTEYAKYFLGSSNSLSSYILPGSALYSSLFETTEFETADSLSGYSAVSCEFEKFEISDYAFIADDCFITDVSFSAEATTEDEAVANCCELTGVWVWVKSGGVWYLCSSDAAEVSYK